MTDVRTVSVDGSGRVSAVPDVVRVQIGVAVADADVSTAMDRAGVSMRAVIAAVVDAGVARTDLATSQLSVQPQYRRGDDPGITGYEVSNMLTATVRELDAAGSVLSAAAGAGGDDLRVHGLSLSVADPSGALTAARDAAFADARDRAEQYARLAGASLGRGLSISEGAPSTSPVPRLAAFAGGEPPIEAGEQQFSASVAVVFELV
ncbi:SIMPL domain-containing protein [Gordonia neofelifaecis]|uniref:DUF541 domain-containing protein n=1 Tax=Gordonia neofelifaecis NRRL B-59395 TaxID=644548 RepID=F1YJC8_9ACTN|nr:SIMPL domain-containing protein [Gordonia neofelifaecis]EGD55161.1 hypothetical protein SCNU_09824 [Gordonia neofelifaecis NRRL B-59395]